MSFQETFNINYYYYYYYYYYIIIIIAVVAVVVLYSYWMLIKQVSYNLEKKC